MAVVPLATKAALESVAEDVLPEQDDQAGKFLATDGESASWQTIEAGDALPAQSGQEGRVLSTDGTDAEWVELGSAAFESADDFVQPGDTGTVQWVAYDNHTVARPTGAAQVIFTPSDNSLPDPENATEDDIVIRSQTGVSLVYVHDGDDYVAAGGRTFVGPEPTLVTPAVGDMWVDPSDAVMYAWDGVEWVVLAGEAPEPSAPGKVSGLTLTPGIEQVLIEWTAPATGGSPIIDYVIERAADDNGVPVSWSTLTDGTNTNLFYTDSGVDGGDTYWYRVSAENAVGTGDPSDPEDVTPDTAPAFFIVESQAAELSTSAPTVTFDNPPEEGDLVVLCASHDLGASLYDSFDTANWTMVTGNLVQSNDGDVGCGMAFHVVTSGETSQTLWQTRFFQTGETGGVVGAIIRGADDSSPLDAEGSANSNGTATPHVIAGLTGADLEDGSLVVSFITSDGSGTSYGSDPAGWTTVSDVGGGAVLPAGKLLRRDAFTSSSVDVDPANITPSATEQYASVTAAFTAA